MTAVPSVEVDVGPSEPEALAAPAAARGEEDPRRQVLALGGVVEERSKLLGRPRLRSMGAGGGRRWGSGGVSDVAHDPVPAQGVLEGGVDDRVDVAHCPWRQAGGSGGLAAAR